MADKTTDKLPIHIVTGFLGSGKTSFIQKILKNDNNVKTLVLINEFGEVGLDDLLIKPIASNTYLLPSGCMCCTVLNDVKETLLSALDLNKDSTVFTRILIETTGLANPASILATLTQDVHLKGRFCVDGITTIVDCQHAQTQAKTAPEWLPQVVACQQFLISKTDLCDEYQYQQVQALIHKVNPDSRQIDVDDLITMDKLFGQADILLPMPQFFLKSEQVLHNNTHSLVLEFHRPLDWLGFGLWLNLLLAKHGEKILRLKGLLHLKGQDKPILLHGVQHCLYLPEHLEQSLWNDDVSRLVLIVRGLDVNKIKVSAEIVLRHLMQS